MALTLKLGEDPSMKDMSVPLGGTTPRKGTLLRTLSSRAKMEDSPLEWTKTPTKKIVTDGNMLCSMSEPAKAGESRANKPFLKSPLCLEPTAASSPKIAPRASSKGVREIVVKEADLRRYGNDLRKLKECQVHQIFPGAASSKKEFELSFKSAFALRCRIGAELRDPWQDMKNPEFSREQNEQDLVLNQVWVDAMQHRRKQLLDFSAVTTPRKDGLDTALWGSPRTPGATESPSGATAAPNSARGAATSGRRRYKRTGSQACLACQRKSCLACAHGASDVLAGGPDDGTLRPWRQGSQSRPESRESASKGSRARALSAASGEQKLLKKQVENRIKNIEDVFGAEDEDAEAGSGSMAVRQATKMQRGHMRTLTDKLYYDEVLRSAWLAIDAETGDVTFYHKTVGERLESAYRSGRASVPLAGLGREVDGTIVTFPRGDVGGTKIIETSLKGNRREVQRVPVPGTTREVQIIAVREAGSWRFEMEGDREVAAQKALSIDISDDPEDFLIVDKRLAFTGQEIVVPENKLPPVNRNQRTYYINPNFTEYY
mmetsp:Transcript_72495/g.208029  ORF Transcript_72495/g.208029 Transcript_72495/m.208029 type:complete len:546 (+) Transcript_72495:75-1712(+)